MNVLITGGAGYLGSHTAVELISAGHDVVLLDNYSNSSPKTIDAIKQLTHQDIPLINGDILDKRCLHELFEEHKPEGVIHFAAHKAVGESVKNPLKYYQNNVQGSVSLLDVMIQHDVRTIVYSSSAAIYGNPDSVPIRETAVPKPRSPYGRTKLNVETLLHDLYKSTNTWEITILRYFNPVGAHESGAIGEEPLQEPTNLVPLIGQVAAGHVRQLSVFGNDYPTRDGTGIRDYIHVIDLARGHVKALERLHGKPQIATYNLGTGVGYSVLEVIKCFEGVVGQEIPYKIVARRSGDVSECFADATKARTELGWTTEFDLVKMCEDAWRWQCNNPDGIST